MVTARKDGQTGAWRDWLLLGPVMVPASLLIGDRIILQHVFGQAEREASRITTPCGDYSGPNANPWLNGHPIRGELILIALQALRITIAWYAWRWGGWLASPVWIVLGWRALVYSR